MNRNSRLPNAITAPEPNIDRVACSPRAVSPKAISGSKRGVSDSRNSRIRASIPWLVGVSSRVSIGWIRRVATSAPAKASASSANCDQAAGLTSQPVTTPMP